VKAAAKQTRVGPIEAFHSRSARGRNVGDFLSVAATNWQLDFQRSTYCP
jgi:hypothetical protein